MLRITTIEPGDTGVRLRVEGRLTGRSVEELRQSCKIHNLSKGAALTLDLADVSFADPQGIALLKDLNGNGVVLVNLAPFLFLQLGEPMCT